MDKTENTIREKETEEPEHTKKKKTSLDSRTIALGTSTVYVLHALQRGHSQIT